MKKSIQLQYFAILREQRGINSETVQTSAANASELYEELKKQHRFPLPSEQLKVAINDEFQSWDTPLNNEDRVAFIPPVAGG